MRVRKAGRRLLIFGSISIFVLVSIAISVITRINEIHTIKIEKEELQAKLEELVLSEELVQSELEKLQDPDYVARYAREKYLYSKEDEFIILIP